MRNILVLVHDDEGQESRLQAALAVTRALSGHLYCLDVFTMPPILSDPWTGYSSMVVLDDALARDSRNVTEIKRRLQLEDVAWTMLNATGDPATELRRGSDLADLIVVTSHGEKHSVIHERAIVGDIVMKARRPVLAAPPAYDRLDVAGRAMVAWDGSSEADAALRASTPLLALADEVAILVVNPVADGLPAQDAATYLSRHGVVSVVVEQHTDYRIADIILAQAGKMNASYIVMGAFGRGRAMEAVFGGVTRTLLIESEVPLLLAH